jgi:hypothetical protein
LRDDLFFGSLFSCILVLHDSYSVVEGAAGWCAVFLQGKSAVKQQIGQKYSPPWEEVLQGLVCSSIPRPSVEGF